MIPALTTLENARIRADGRRRLITIHDEDCEKCPLALMSPKRHARCDEGAKLVAALAEDEAEIERLKRGQRVENTGSLW